MTTRLQVALQDCLELLESGRADIDTCLSLYPDLSNELEPLLRSAQKLLELQSIQPSPEFKQRARLALQAHMHDHPKASPSRKPLWSLSRRMQAAVSVLALALVFLTTGTVLAQSALPGQPLYAWKLASERAWAGLSGQPQATSLHLSERRVDELLAVHGITDLEEQVLQGYTSTLDELLMDVDAAPDFASQVYESLTEQQSKLMESGIEIPELDDAITHFAPLLPPEEQDSGGAGEQQPASATDQPEGNQQEEENQEGDDSTPGNGEDLVDEAGDIAATAIPDPLKP